MKSVFSVSHFAWSSAAVIAFLPVAPALVQVEAPHYEECRLETIFPAGGQRGQKVTVEFSGNNGGLDGAKQILIDGPPGITVREVKNVNVSVCQATLDIAADAPPGRRCLRVVCERSGITNMAWFVVGSLPEVIEAEPNNERAKAQAVTMPVVVNGRVTPAADLDSFRFAGKAGQKISVAAVAYAVDTHGQGGDYGITDAEVIVLDSQGRVIAEAQDTLGLDPLVQFTAPADGEYVAQVQLGSFRGFPQAVYRLTIGEVPVVTSVFPPGGKRGEKVALTFGGANFAGPIQQEFVVPTDETRPVHYLFPDGPAAGNHDVLFVAGDLPEAIEAEPNDERVNALAVSLPITASGRFQQAGDADCYRVALKAGETLEIETMAHRYLRAPVDTRLQVLDDAGKVLVENDDGFALDYMWMHDFLSPDSRLTFKAPQDGNYIVRVLEQSGTFGERAVYRLTARLLAPDFQLWQFPDGVPIWGPGTTAGLLVKIDRLAGFEENVEVSLEGLPAGWTATKSTSFGNAQPRPLNYFRDRVFLTVTPPADVPVGSVAEFRVIGAAKKDGKEIRRVAQPLTLFYSSDTGFFRATPKSYIAVAKPRGLKLTPEKDSLEVGFGKTVEIPVKVGGVEDGKTISVLVNICSNGVACGYGSPTSLVVKDGRVVLPFAVGDQLPPGSYPICVALAWRSDIRIGMPGPCTPLFPLKVLPAEK